MLDLSIVKNKYIDAGVEKVILGSGAIKNKEFLKKACEKFKGQIALGLDSKNGNLSVSGWKENLNVKTIDFLKEVNSYGVSRIIYTDINRDGMKISPNFDESRRRTTTLFTTGSKTYLKSRALIYCFMF